MAAKWDYVPARHDASTYIMSVVTPQCPLAEFDLSTCDITPRDAIRKENIYFY